MKENTINVIASVKRIGFAYDPCSKEVAKTVAKRDNDADKHAIAIFRQMPPSNPDSTCESSSSII